MRLVVEDSGTGIPADELAFIFDPFRRATAPGARTQEGTGLGLAIVRELVNLHGGTVDVTSTVGVGSTFTVTIPRHRRVVGAGSPTLLPGLGRQLSASAGDTVQSVENLLAPSSANGRAATPLTEDMARPADDVSIYVIDDNADMRSYITGVLCPLWDVTTFGDPVEALEAISAGPLTWC